MLTGLVQCVSAAEQKQVFLIADQDIKFRISQHQMTKLSDVKNILVEALGVVRRCH